MKPNLECTGRLKVVQRMCPLGEFSLSVGSKDTRMADINIDIDDGVSPDIVASATHLPFKDQTFDRVLFTDVIEHLQRSDESIALAEINRVLKGGKELILSTPNDVGLYALLDLARYVGIHRHYTPEYVVRLLQKSGFEVESAFTSGGYWECINTLWYCLLVYPLNRALHTRLPYAPSFMLAAADKQYQRARKRGYTIFIKARRKLP
jgi:SAM-dependent methyltransferase